MPTKQQLINTLAFTIIACCAKGAFAQENTESPEPWIGVVTSEGAKIRCGANESYYTIVEVKAGDLVQVHGKRQDWMKVDTSSNVFEETVGYIKYPAAESSVFEVIDSNGTANSTIEVLAKNMESDELYRSWRPILRLESGDVVEIVSSEITEPGTLHRDSYIVHKVKMPENGFGWINTNNIKQASPKQVALFFGRQTQEVVLDDTVPGVEVGVTPEAGGEFSQENINPIESVEAPTLEPLSLVDLEAAWEKITAEPVMGAEVSPLRVMYAELLTSSGGDIVIDQIAGGRIKQLDVWAGLQEQRVRIENLRESLAKQAEDVNEYQSIMSLYGDYVVAGKLALSNTFDGRLRPFMYRVQDPKSGRTLGYLPANDDWELSGILGQTIGVVGNSKWNPNWRVNVVEASRFDILSPTTATVTPDIQ